MNVNDDGVALLDEGLCKKNEGKAHSCSDYFLFTVALEVRL